jgi:hypothetical protein
MPARVKPNNLSKPGTPPGIRTRKFMFLRHARMPIPPAGHCGRGASASRAHRPQRPAGDDNKKARGPCGATRAFAERGTVLTLRDLRSLGCGRAPIVPLGDRRADESRDEGKRGPALIRPRLAACRRYQQSPHRVTRHVPFQSRTKKPGALARSGLLRACGGLQPLAPVVRTNASLAVRRAILSEDRKIPGIHDSTADGRRAEVRSRDVLQFHPVPFHAQLAKGADYAHR